MLRPFYSTLNLELFMPHLFYFIIPANTTSGLLELVLIWSAVPLALTMLRAKYDMTPQFPAV